MMIRAGSKDGCSDPQTWNGKVCDHKRSYDRDNSVIFSKSPYRWKGLRPRCWIALSWGKKKLPRVRLFVY